MPKRGPALHVAFEACDVVDMPGEDRFRYGASIPMGKAMSPGVLLALLLLKPAATLLCLGSGVPGGLFTPSLALGAMLGGVLGLPWSHVWPGVPPGLFAVLGAGAVLAATTQGPISTVVLLMELIAHARAFIVPLLLIVAVATLVARTIEPRSIYDARLSDRDVAKRLADRDRASQDSARSG